MKHKSITKPQELTFNAQVLLSLCIVFDLLPRPFEGKTTYFKRRISGHVPYRVYMNIMNSLERKGWLKIYKDKGRSFIKLSQEGILEGLFIKAKLQQSAERTWDGKWRMIIFDIPEDTRGQRRKMRFLLKENGFIQIQQSVYVNPYPLNREALSYLKNSGLNAYVRIFRVDDVDDDTELRKIFRLS